MQKTYAQLATSVRSKGAWIVQDLAEDQQEKEKKAKGYFMVRMKCATHLHRPEIAQPQNVFDTLYLLVFQLFQRACCPCMSAMQSLHIS